MVDRTKDNEIRPGKRGDKKPHRFRLFFFTLVIVLAVVAAAAWRDGTGFDALRRHFSYRGAESGAVRYTYDDAFESRCASLGESLVVLSDASLRLLNSQGGETWSTPVRMSAPALSQAGDRAVAYDVGGTELYVLDETGELLHLTASGDEPIIFAGLNGRGMLTVTSEKLGYKGCVDVYDESMTHLYQFFSTERFILSATANGSGRQVAVVSLGQEEGSFVGSVSFYDRTKGGEAAAESAYTIPGGIVLALAEREGKIVTVSDTSLTYGTESGASVSYSYGGAYLRGYDLGGDGYTALLLNRYQSGSMGKLVTVDQEGREIGSLEIREEVLGLSAAGRYVAVLYAGRLVIYNQELQVYASLQGADAVRDVLMRPDGSALLLSAGSASLFLP